MFGPNDNDHVAVRREAVRRLNDIADHVALAADYAEHGPEDEVELEHARAFQMIEQLIELLRIVGD